MKKSEKMKGGVVDSVAYANGKGGHISYNKSAAKNYAGQSKGSARSYAAKSMKGGC